VGWTIQSSRLFKPTVPTELEAGWVPEPVWTYWKRKSLALPGHGTLDCPAHSLVTMSTILSWLLVKLKC